LAPSGSLARADVRTVRSIALNNRRASRSLFGVAMSANKRLARLEQRAAACSA
jgi:hypothetical protein